mgnify:CR=1 FL=1
MLMRVAMYAPHKLYGFAESDEGRVFFHTQVFQPGEPGPPPIVGEPVEVYLDNATSQEGKCPRALQVLRLDRPERLRGFVDDFNPDKGWGFVRDAKGRSFYLHRSEVLDGKLPLKGRRVAFYEGAAKGRPRACYVEVDP